VSKFIRAMNFTKREIKWFPSQPSVKRYMLENKGDDIFLDTFVATYKYEICRLLEQALTDGEIFAYGAGIEDFERSDIGCAATKDP